ncbi:MAG: DNA polymerase III subunit delta [Chloroflexi bacterium]|nr:DNA polymerase III subunit delta [Chloroflexota bacterium]
MFYILHGEDEFSLHEALTTMRAKMGERTLADLNTTVLDGRKLTLTELMNACNAIPFVAKRRLVIVENFASRLEGPPRGQGKARGVKANDELLQALREYLPKMPETTRLVFVENHTLSPQNPLLELAQQEKGGYVKTFEPPKGDALTKWIVERVRTKGGEIEVVAATELANFVGNDLRKLDQECEKLVLYTAGERTITTEDVCQLVSHVQAASIFTLVDALGHRERERAMQLLHEQLDRDATPLYLFSMIVRQFRILLQVKELLGHGLSPAEIRAKLGISSQFVVDKAVAQSRQFSMERLECIYQRLVNTDADIKTGCMPEILALDLLVVDLCR